jgi:ATP-dependent RNA helicase DHX37/DHR1
MSDTGNGDSLLSADLQNALPPDPHAVQSSGKKKKSKKRKNAGPKQKPKSKAQIKKLAKLKERRALKSRRTELLSDHTLHRVGASTQQLLHSTGEMGKKITKRSRANRAFLEHKAGFEVDDEDLHGRESRKRKYESASDAEMEESASSHTTSTPTPSSSSSSSTAALSMATPANAADPYALSFSVPSLRTKKKRKTLISVSSSSATSATIASAAPPALTLIEKMAAYDLEASLDTLKKQESIVKQALWGRIDYDAARAIDSEAQGAEEDDEEESEEEDVVVEGRVQVEGEGEEETEEPASKRAKRTHASLPTQPKPPNAVHVARTEEIQAQRIQLPILMMEQELIEAVNQNPVVVVCGETGSGKTTQLPQFLYEAGYGQADGDHPGMIAVTEPRRVAAISTAKRVSHEMNVEGSSKVAYQVRFDNQSDANTQIKFMTDGVLLREIQKDFLLRRYSVVVLDEAHERGVNTDILIGLLSRIIPLRATMAAEQKQRKKKLADGEKRLCPLKMVIMSATLRVSDFTENLQLFKDPPPVVEVDSRQHPVTVHFNRRTALDDWLLKTKRKVQKIHQELPPGGVLVFLTGKQEIDWMVTALREEAEEQKFSGFKAKGGHGSSSSSSSSSSTTTITATTTSSSSSSSSLDSESGSAADVEQRAEKEPSLDTEDAASLMDVEDDDFVDSVTDAASNASARKPVVRNANPECQRLLVLPLYSALPNEKQLEVFKAVPEGTRLIVVATNVAETSVTIPSIKYVVDTGRVKHKMYDKRSGLSQFVVGWVSQASAKQRAGRAGRTGPGHVYRMYSSAVFHMQFQVHTPPEILRSPVEGTLLHMKALGVENVFGFPFPTAPEDLQLRHSMINLQVLSAVRAQREPVPPSSDGYSLTDLGQRLSAFPVAPRFAKMIALANQQKCLPYVIALVAGLSVETLFYNRRDAVARYREKMEAQVGAEACRKWSYEAVVAKWTSADAGDVLSRLPVIGAYVHLSASKKLARLKRMEQTRETRSAVYEERQRIKRSQQRFCIENGLRLKSLQDVVALRHQLTRLAHAHFSTPEEQRRAEHAAGFKPPTAEQVRVSVCVGGVTRAYIYIYICLLVCVRSPIIYM